MKIIGIFLASLIYLQLFACKTNEETEPTNVNPTNTSTSDTTTSNKKMKITIGTKVFTATFNDNATAFKARFPMTINMTDLNSNEKKFDLTVNLPTNIEEIGTIHEGDILLWGNNTIVLFYKSFSTPYRYTKIGKIDDANGLAAVVGSGDIKVSFEIEKD